MNIQGSGVSATSGNVDISSQGDADRGINVLSRISTTGGGIFLTTQTNDLKFAAGIEVDGTGDILLIASGGSVVTTDSVWKAGDGQEFDADIQWALTNGWYSVNPVNGEITVDGAPQYEQDIHEANDTVLRAAGGSYIRTNNGTLTIDVQGNIGEAVDGFSVSPRAIIADADTIIVDSAIRQPVHLIITGGVDGSGVTLGDAASNAVLKSGGLTVSNLAGQLTIEQALDSGGGDITIITDHIQINDTVRSIGAHIQIRLQHHDGTVSIILGDDQDLSDDPNLPDDITESDVFFLDQSELDHLADGFYEVTIGDDRAGCYIQIGDPSFPNSTVTIKDPMVIRNPAIGGHIDSYKKGDI